MKKLSEVDSEINLLRSEVSMIGNTVTKSEAAKRKRVNKKIDELKHLRLYLQTNPTPQSLNKHLEHLEARRGRIKDESNFQKWLIANPGSSNDVKKARTQYHKELELKHINSQIKTINYLLQ